MGRIYCYLCKTDQIFTCNKFMRKVSLLIRIYIFISFYIIIKDTIISHKILNYKSTDVNKI